MGIPLITYFVLSNPKSEGRDAVIQLEASLYDPLLGRGLIQMPLSLGFFILEATNDLEVDLLVIITASQVTSDNVIIYVCIHFRSTR